MTVGQAAAGIAAGIPNVGAVTATFLGVEAERARLSTATGDVVLASKAVADWPAPGATVWLVTLGKERIMLGPPSGSSWGVVNAVGTGTAVIEYPEGSGILATYATARGQAVEVGDLVLLDHARLVVVAAYGSPAEPEPVPDTTSRGGRQPRSAEVHAAWDGTAQPNGFWIRDRLLYTRNRSGGPNYATWGYGDGVTRLGIDPDSITEAAVFLARERTGSTHEGGTHTLGGRSGVPSPARTFEVAPTDGWLSIPVDAARALVTGEASGLTFYGGTGTVLRGIAASPGNGRLRVRYTVEG